MMNEQSRSGPKILFRIATNYNYILIEFTQHQVNIFELYHRHSSLFIASCRDEIITCLCHSFVLWIMVHRRGGGGGGHKSKKKIIILIIEKKNSDTTLAPSEALPLC